MMQRVAEYLKQHFPEWDMLNEQEKDAVAQQCVFRQYKKGEIIHRNDEDCKGIMLVVDGLLRGYILSEEGREATLFRVKSGEVCLITASCLMDAIAFDVMMDAMKDTNVFLVPTGVLQEIVKHHMEFELYMCRTINEKFADVLWLLQQILFFSADKRIANFLWDEYVSNGHKTISYTHEEIAKLIGSVREVVSRVLKYMEEEGAITLGRGKIEITDKGILKKYM